MEGVKKRTVSLLFLISAILPAFALDALREPVQLARTFSVRVQDRGKPVLGLRVALMTFNETPQREIASTTTSELGIANFEKVRTGHYYLQWGAWNIAPREEIRVGHGAKQLIREWPCCVIELREIRGNVTAESWMIAEPAERMKLMASRATIALSEVQLELRELRTNRLISRAESDQTGRFRFNDIASGMYILHAVGPPRFRVEGDIRLEVNPRTEAGQLDIGVNPVGPSFEGKKVKAGP